LARTAQIRKGAYPLDRSTADRWTGSTGAIHEPCVSSASALASAPTNHSSPRGATAAHLPAAQAVLQKGPLVSRIHKYTLPPI
jgi:hypothetical protein